MSRLPVDQSVRRLAFSVLPRNPFSFGLVAEFVSRHMPFAGLEFGKLTNALIAQIDTECHLVGAVDNRISAYLGWLRTTPEIAEDWIAVDRLLTDVPGGVAIAITVMAVDHPAYVMQLIREAKRRNPGRSVYWKRYFPDQRPAQGRAVRIAKSERQ